MSLGTRLYTLAGDPYWIPILDRLCVLQALEEKEKGNAAYKKKEFDVALQHYDRALELDPTNITFLTNKAGGYCTGTNSATFEPLYVHTHCCGDGRLWQFRQL